MKKILLFSILIIIIPYIIVSIFIQDKEIKFEYVSNITVRVKRNEKNVIEVIPLEKYVQGVVAGEMPVSFELEALKAQAVAARSYVMKHMEYNKENDYDVVDTVVNQVYLDEDYLKEAWKDKYVEKINKIKTAIIETKGEYLLYDDKIVDALFFSTSVGKTENCEEIFDTSVPYLKSVESSWDSKTSPVFSETTTFTKKDFYEKLGLEISGKLKIKVNSTTSTGRIKEIVINGKSFSSTEVRTKLGIKSTYFNISENDKNIVVTTKGYGHGVGMSQYGAEGMAKEGYTYDQILKYYYQGVEIKQI